MPAVAPLPAGGSDGSVETLAHRSKENQYARWQAHDINEASAPVHQARRGPNPGADQGGKSNVKKEVPQRKHLHIGVVLHGGQSSAFHPVKSRPTANSDSAA